LTQLVITPSYPPVDTSVSLINIKIIDALERLGVQTIVLTVNTDDTLLPINIKLNEIFPSHRKVYRLKTWEQGGALYQGIRAFMRKTPLFNAPDYHLLWELNAIAHLGSIFRENKIDIIHSISAPYCSHIVGLFARALMHKPWICHLDDYWVDQTIFAPKFFNEYAVVNKYLEAICFNLADIILSTSNEILDLSRHRYPSSIQDKYRYLPPSYNPRHYTERKVGQRNNKHRFVFLGKFYKGLREPDNLFAAIEIIKKKNTAVYKRISVELIGTNAKHYTSMIRERGISEVVSLLEQTDYLTSMLKMKDADVLIHVGIINERYESDLHISGKLFEYIGANRMILGITTPKGPVKDFIANIGGVNCIYHDPQSIANAIIYIVRNYPLVNLRGWKYSHTVDLLYNVNYVTSKYKELMMKLT